MYSLKRIVCDLIFEWKEHREYIKSRHDIQKTWKYYVFSCIPMFSNQFLLGLELEDWIPLVVSLFALVISIITLCSVFL